MAFATPSFFLATRMFVGPEIEQKEPHLIGGCTEGVGDVSFHPHNVGVGFVNFC